MTGYNWCFTNSTGEWDEYQYVLMEFNGYFFYGFLWIVPQRRFVEAYQGAALLRKRCLTLRRNRRAMWGIRSGGRSGGFFLRPSILTGNPMRIT